MDIQLKPKPWYIKFRYHIIAAVAFAGVLAYAIVVSLAPRQLRVNDDEITIATVEDGRFMEYVDVEGVVQPISTLKVNIMESGFVSRIIADEGAMLKQGDTILVLTNPEMMRQISDEHDEWEQQQRTYKEQQIEMQQRTITLRQQALDADYEMQLLERKLTIAREEFKMGVKSRAELDVAEEEYRYKKKKTELQLQCLRHDSISNILRQDLIRSDVERANKKFSRSNDRINRLVVTAPCDGQLSYLAVTPGQQVSSGTSVGEIKVMSSYKMHVALNEYYIDRIATGLPASISYNSTDYAMRVSKVVPEIKDRSFSVYLVPSTAMEGQDTAWPDNVRIGKSYRVKIELGQPESAIIIPRGDFYGMTGGQWIYRVSDDGHTASKVPITVGRQNPRQYEITSGLAPGDRVIVNGYEKLKDAERIMIR